MISHRQLKPIVESITKNYNLKFLSESIKIFTNDESDFYKLKQLLIQKSLLQFIFRTNAEKIDAKIDKFVLFGLNTQITPEMIKEEMNLFLL